MIPSTAHFLPQDEPRRLEPSKRSWTAHRLISSTYKDLGSPSEVELRFRKHLLKSDKCIQRLSFLLHLKPKTTRDFSFEVDCLDLMNSDNILGTMLIKYPTVLLPVLENAIVEAQRDLVQIIQQNDRRQDIRNIEDGLKIGQEIIKGDRSPECRIFTRVHARLIHLPPHRCECRFPPPCYLNILFLFAA
mmetsp:Transcript_50811/g.59344  ORF Transcript_50811/g.59344 Transcript_50811/m.59344 type:complete len:189 (+) Transcript_50811:62-628(+)